MGRAYNLNQRLVIDNDGTLCRITKMFDGNGDETKDAAAARVVVAKRGPRQWLTVLVNEDDDMPGRVSDYDCADAMIRDLAAEGVAILPRADRIAPADLLSAAYVHEFDGVTTLDTILSDWGFRDGERADFARWLIETILHKHHIAGAEGTGGNADG